ncbi:MAG TPA: phosphotransferase [Gammaproteobacteria bacterium]|nr:phosphotransferase [Gammaproteobacteria bacterium]
MTDQTPPPAVVEAYDLDPASIETLGGGLINLSFGVVRPDGSRCVLQRLNRIFPPEVDDDLDAVTRHLSGKGLATPRLIRTGGDDRHISVDGAIWRLLTRIEGETRETVGAEAQAAEAGRVLGEFHLALADFDQPLCSTRPRVHDIGRHLAALRRALDEHASHPAHRDVVGLAATIFDLAGRLDPLPAEPERVVHGDPKISNVVFRNGLGICLVDLDTIARMPVAFELGDALRSWCNPAGEDSPEALLSIERFRLALEGYLAGAPGLLGPDEWRAIPNATLAIAIELAARFAADALNENYFSWDRERFATASAHNRARAAAQLALAESVRRAMPSLSALVAAAPEAGPD